jgi:Family of unknown function (DUF6152)
VKYNLTFFIALLASFAIVAVPAAAHHGSQGYDFSGPRKTLKGTVTRYAWANPHAQLYLDVKDDKGNIVNWVMELNNPGNLVGLGWTHSSIKAGDVVTVIFNAGLNGKPIGICTDVVFADGRKLHSSQGCTDTNQGTFDKLYPQGSK